MTHLPVGEHWSFSSTAYLLEDSYLFSVGSEAAGHGSLQSIARFALLSLPICSFLLALINAIGFTRLVAANPNPSLIRRLHSGNCLIALCILTMMLSGLLWATVLPRLIHFGAEPVGGNLTHAQSTGRIFAAQLPAILTTQTTLRIASIWFSVYILIRQLSSLAAARNCPACVVVDKVPPQSPVQLSDRPRSQQYLLQPFLRAARSMHHIFLSPPPPAKDKFDQHPAYPADCTHTLRELPCCFRCRMSAQRRQFAEVWSDHARTPESSPAASSCRHASFTQFKQLCPALIITGCIVGFSMILCIPQIWNYRIHLKRLTSNQQQLRSQYTWSVTNNAGSSAYEYILAIFGLLLPAFCLLVLLILFSYRITQMSLSSYWLAQRLPDTYERTLTTATARLLWETKFVGLVVLLAFIGWLPLTATNTVHRLSQLVRGAADQQQQWPDLTTWLVCELCILAGDFIVQFVLLVMLLCESACSHRTRQSADDPVEEDFALAISPYNSPVPPAPPPTQGRSEPNDSFRVNSTLQDMESLQVSEFAASSQFSALHCVPDSGVSSATACTNNEKMEMAAPPTARYFASPNNAARALVSAEVSVTYGSGDCGSSFCPGGGGGGCSTNRHYEVGRDGRIYPPSSCTASWSGGAHQQTPMSPPPLPPPNYTYGFPSPDNRGGAYHLQGGMKSNGFVSSSPPEKLPCFRSVLSPLPPKVGEDAEDFIDAGINDVGDDDSEESGSRYFDQQGVLVSKL